MGPRGRVGGGATARRLENLGADPHQDGLALLRMQPERTLIAHDPAAAASRMRVLGRAGRNGPGNAVAGVVSRHGSAASAQRIVRRGWLEEMPRGRVDPKRDLLEPR